MNLKHAIIAANLVVFVPVSALAEACDFERSEMGRQADKLKMTVLNFSSRELSANLVTSGESHMSVLNSANRLETRTVPVPKVWARGKDAVIESSDHGFEIEVSPSEHQNHFDTEVLNLRFKVINARSVGEDGSPSFQTGIENTDYTEWHHFRHLNVSCSAQYYDRAHSYWHYKVTIKDK